MLRCGAYIRWRTRKCGGRITAQRFSIGKKMEGKCRRGGAEKKEIEGGCRKRKWEGDK
jgi:hypothetical protein